MFSRGNRGAFGPRGTPFPCLPRLPQCGVRPGWQFLGAHLLSALGIGVVVRSQGKLGGVFGSPSVLFGPSRVPPCVIGQPLESAPRPLARSILRTEPSFARQAAVMSKG